MTYGFAPSGYGGSYGLPHNYEYWPFPASFDPMIPHGSHHQSQAYLLTQNGDLIDAPTSAAETIYRNWLESYNNPITASGGYASSNLLDENLPLPPQAVEVAPNSWFVPSSCLNPQSGFDQSRIPFGDGIPSSNNGYPPGIFVGPQSNLPSSSVEPVNSNVPFGYQEAIGSGSTSNEDLNHHFTAVSSKGPSATAMFSMGAGNGNAQSSAVNCKAPFGGSSRQRSENVQANQKPRKSQEHSKSNTDDVSTGFSSESPLFDQANFPRLTSSPGVTYVVNAMHNLSEMLVSECFDSRSTLKPEQLENLDKVVDNLTKCLKKLTGNKTIAAEEASAMHLSAKPVDKNEMIQSMKNMLASNFPEGGEKNSLTDFYRNLWLDAEADLPSTTYMTLYHRIKNEIGTLNLDNKVTKSRAARESSRFNSDSVGAALSLVSRSLSGCVEQTIHQESPASTIESKPNDIVDRFQILKHQETERKLKSQNRADSDLAVLNKFQILTQQETERKLKSQNCPKTEMSDHENYPKVLEMARFDRSGHGDDVMDRFEILKSRVAEQVEKSLNSLDIDSESEDDQPRSKTQMRPASLMPTLWEFNTELSAADDSESDESTTSSDWEHVLNDD